MPAPPLRIDLERLRADMTELGRIGAVPGLPGINRPSFSDEDMAARRWLMAECHALGLRTAMDAVGNVTARWGPADGPAVMVGSHLDSVPQGGFFDGTLGVCAALEAVRTLKAAGLEPRTDVEIVATAEEEGRFGGMLGAQALCGLVDPDWFAAAHDETGIRLVDALRAQGLDPDGVEGCARAPGEIASFLELHIEQGPALEAAGLEIGIVDMISGCFVWTVMLAGDANHSGTTPMDLRRDAYMGAARFAVAIPEIIARVGTAESRLTVGKIEVRPNFAHTIPGEVAFSLVGRDVDEAVMHRLAAACRVAIADAAEAHGLAHRVEAQSWLAPVACDTDLVQLLTAQARGLGQRAIVMPSGAGHDAQCFAQVTRAGLIFVPSVGGISHAPEEDTAWPDVARGADLLLHALIELAEVAGAKQ
jgi:N-carbamoyl-L-amino-acid hydrolase